MKEIKVKNVPSTDTIGSGSYSQKHLQATEEQIRYAKLSQMTSKEESKLQEKMKEVSEVTRKPPDIVSIALHDCSYDTNLAIHNILEGYYDENPEGDWKTKSTKNRKKTAASPVETSPTHNESTEATIDKLCNDFGTIDMDDQKPTHTPNRLSRGGGTGRGRSTNQNSDSWDKSPPEERFGDPPEKVFSNKERGRSNDRGRGRGRGRGLRGGLNRGVRGGRGGFGRGGGSFRGSARQNRGFNRGNSSRDRGSGYRKQDNDVVRSPVEESWDMDSPEKSNDHVQDWADETPTTNTNDNIQTDWGREDSNWGNNKEDEWNKEETDWSKDNWGEQPEQSKAIFPRDVDWSQLNNQDTDGWIQNSSTPPKNDRLKYIPENIDTAVIRSIPNSSTTGEVTSYQPTDDISRYINSPSNQFPSSHQEGGLTNSLKDRAFSLPSSSNVSDVIRTISSMPIVSGVTESHKLEQEQLRTSKSHLNKPRRANKYNLPSQPVVMPRSARMVNDVEEQFTGLEFGSGPLSPRVTFTDKQPPLSDLIVSNNHDVSQNVMAENIPRHPVALPNENLVSHAPKVLPQSSNISVIPGSKIETSNPQSQIISKADVLKTPPGFKPLDQNASHYLTSPGRGHPHLTPEPIPFPSSTNRTSPTSTINVFSRNGGLGTSVVISEQQSPVSNYSDKTIYDQHENNINAEKIIAEQKALAEKQFRAEQQLVLSEKNERTRPVIDQRSFNEEKPQVQNKLLSNKLKSNEQQVTPEELSRNDRLSNDMPEQRKNISDTRVALNDAHRQKDGIKLKGDGNVSAKVHGQSSTTNQLTSAITKSTYISGAVISSEMLSLNSNSTLQTTKSQIACNKTTSGAPPGVLTPMNLYAGVQPGIMPTYQQQALHGYSYDELLQMQRVPMPPYTYDVSMFPSAAATGPTSAREGIQTYGGNESKFNRGADEQQGTPHVATGNIPTQAAYMNATGQLPYGYTYAYQPSVLPQGGVYPAFTTQSVYQMTQGKGTQYQTQYQPSAQQQTAYNSSKYSGSAGHEFSKANYHNNPAGQVALTAHPKATQQNSSSSPSSSTIQSGPRSAYKSQYNQDGKGYLANVPTSMTTQHGIHMHNQAVAAAAHIGNVNHYLVQPHTNLMTHSGQISASHLNHPQMDASSHRSQVHQIPFSGNQQKRDSKASYGSYWLGNR